MARVQKSLLVLTAVTALTVTVLTGGIEHRSTETASSAPAGAVSGTASQGTASSATAEAAATRPMARRTPVVDPEVDEQLVSQEMTTVLVSLAGEFTGTDAQQSAGVRSAVDALVSTLPEGSYSDLRPTGVLPLAIFRASAAAVEVLRSSAAVQAVEADDIVTVASESARFRDGSATSNLAGWKGDNTTVAVIDSGIQSDHPYLMSGTTKKVIAEACFTTPGSGTNAGGAFTFLSPCTGTPMTVNSPAKPGSAGPCTYADAGGGCKHGTHIAGVIAGEPGKLPWSPALPEVVSGVAPNARLISIQVFGQFQQGQASAVSANTTDIVTALGWLYEQRVNHPNLSAVNISIASTSLSKKYAGDCSQSEVAYYNAVQKLKDVGIATIASSGNSGWNDGISPPACLSNTVGVGAIDDATGQRAPYSNINNSLELLAPGSVIFSSWPGSIGGIESGTSQAAPAVAGAWALMRQKYPNSGAAPKTVTQILTMLRNSGTNVSTTVTLPGGTNPVTPPTTVTYIIPRMNLSRALGIPTPSRVAIGSNFSCAADSDGTVTCSGANASGQLGVSPITKPSSLVPLRIAGLTRAVDVTAGDTFACAKLASTVRCWGSNTSGQLGVGTTSTLAGPTPAAVRTGALFELGNTTSPVSSVSARGSSACAVRTAGAAGTVFCWGANNLGQLGDGTAINRSYAVQVKTGPSASLTGVTSVSMGGGSACAILTAGTVRCWGDNTDGALGNNSTTASRYAVPVAGIDGTTVKATSVSVGTGFACATVDIASIFGNVSGGVRCWGRNTVGQLGTNTTTRSLVPVEVKTTSATANSSSTTTPITLTGASTVSAGAQHACAIVKSGDVSKGYCWGLNTDRQLGVGTSNRWFAAATFGTKSIGASALATGPNNTSFVVFNAMVSVGVNSSGQLGLNNITNQTSLVWSLRF